MARRRSGVGPLAFIVLLAGILLSLTLTQGWSPALGLDLQGGASVIFEPCGSDVSDQALDDAVEIIRSRVDDLGVAEPEIVRQGDNIVVELPGIDDRERALENIGRTAELQFRPVLQVTGYLTDAQLDEILNPEPSPSPSPEAAPEAAPEVEEEGAGFVGGVVPGGFARPVRIAQDAGGETSSSGGCGSGDVEPEPSPNPSPSPSPDPNPDSAPDDGAEAGSADAADPAAQFEDRCIFGGGTTPLEENVPEATVVFPDVDGEGEDDADDEPQACFQLGPVPTDGILFLTGRAVTGPDVQLAEGQWGVSLDIRDREKGLFNQVASQCFSGIDPTCPAQGGAERGQLAIVLDGEVVSAPTINVQAFDERVTISGNFTESEARDLALVLRYGALPVELEPQDVRLVSATLGETSLDAGLAAGFVGMGLVALYILVYYRALGVVVLLGLLVWSAINFSVIAWLGDTQGLALSLAGVTGIVVSIGVTVDSYVVYFERLKDEIRSGKTIRSSVDRGFQRAFRTILAADISSLLGALFLYTLTVGPVRGFAFFLGLSTLLDIFVAYFFTRPLVALFGRSSFFTSNKVFGVARGLGQRTPAVTGGD